MNRIKAIALIVAFLLLSGCAANVERAEPDPQNVSMFVIVETTSRWYVVADKKTGVMYAVSKSNGSSNLGNFTLLVDAEGKPLIWEGGKE